MASISYEEVFGSFLGNVTDYNLASLSVTDAYEIMSEYLHKTMAEPYVYRLFSTVKLDDETQTIHYTLADEYDESVDDEFIVTALGKWMVYEWLHRQVRSITNTAQAFMNKENKFYSQKEHLSELRALQDDSFKEAQRFILNRGYIANSYLSGGLT